MDEGKLFFSLLLLYFSDKKIFNLHNFKIDYIFCLWFIEYLDFFFSSKHISNFWKGTECLIFKYCAWFNLILYAKALTTISTIIILLNTLRIPIYWQLNEISTHKQLVLALKQSFKNAAWNGVLSGFCNVLKENSDILKKAEKHELNG